MPRKIKKIELFGRNLLSRILSMLFSQRQTFHRVPADEKIERILLLRQDKIGDMVVSLPAIRAVKKFFPDAKIALLVSRRNAPVIEYEERVEKIFYEKAPHKFFASLIKARKFHPDVIIDLQMKPSTTSLLYVLFSGARWKVGARRSEKSPFNVQVPANESLHIVDGTAKIVSGLCGDVDLSQICGEVKISEAELAFAQKFWSRSRIDPKKCVGVNISAGSPTRFFQKEKFIEICRFIKGKNYIPLLFYAPQDLSAAKTIKVSAGGTEMIPQTPTILHAAAILKTIKILLSPDTSLIHIAESFNIPVIGLYPKGEENRVRWGPRKPESIILQSNRTNSLDGIDVADVKKAVEKMLKNIETSRQ